MDTHTHTHYVTFRLAVSAVLVFLFPEHFGQDDLVLLIQFLGFFSLRPRRHLGQSGVASPVVGPVKETQSFIPREVSEISTY